MSESSINQLLDEKTKDNDYESKQSIMNEKQVDSEESISSTEPSVTVDSVERTKEQEVNLEFTIKSDSIEDWHEDKPEINFNPAETHKESSEIATVTDVHEDSIVSKKENVALKTELKTSSYAEVGYDDNKSCDKRICLPTGNLEPNFIDSFADSDTTTTVSAKAWVKIENKQDCGKTAKSNRFNIDNSKISEQTRKP